MKMLNAQFLPCFIACLLFMSLTNWAYGSATTQFANRQNEVRPQIKTESMIPAPQPKPESIISPTETPLPPSHKQALRSITKSPSQSITHPRSHNPEQTKYSGKYGIASFSAGLLGIIAVLLGFVFSVSAWVVLGTWFLLSLLAIVLGIIGIQPKRKRRGLAIAGIILGGYAILGFLLFALFPNQISWV